MGSGTDKRRDALPGRLYNPCHPIIRSNNDENSCKNKKTHTFDWEDMGFFVSGIEGFNLIPTNYSNRVIYELP